MGDFKILCKSGHEMWLLDEEWNTAEEALEMAMKDSGCTNFQIIKIIEFEEKMKVKED